MLTYTTSLTLFQRAIGNSETGATNFFNSMFNENVRDIYSRANFPFLKGSQSITTIASTRFYDLKYNFKKLVSIYLTVGTQLYNMKPVRSRVSWDLLNASTSPTSDSPDRYYIDYDGSVYRIGIYPQSTTASYTITVIFTKRIKDVDTADYTTGTVTLTNNSTAVVGSGTTFTAAMVGRWIKGNNDKGWYKIASFTDATHITLEHEYQGVTTAGLSYTIGETTELPEDYQAVPVFMTIADWFAKEGKLNLAKTWYDKAEKRILELIADFNSLSDDPVLDEGIFDDEIKNPNLYLTSKIT